MKPVLYIAFLSILFLACKKNNSEIQALKTGAIKGVLSNPGAVEKISFSSASLDTFIRVGDPASANFLIANLPPAQYIVSVTPKTGYLASADTQVVVQAADTADAGTFMLFPAGPSLLRFSLLDETGTKDTFDLASPVVQCTYVNNVLLVTTAKGTTAPYWYFTFQISGVTGIGTYTCNQYSTTSFVKAYDVYVDGYTTAYTTQVFNTDLPGASGLATFNITALDTTNHIISGTFSGRVLSAGMGYLIKAMSYGSFKLSY